MLFRIPLAKPLLVMRDARAAHAPAPGTPPPFNSPTHDSDKKEQVEEKHIFCYQEVFKIDDIPVWGI
jgi:hypothetical protein